MNPRLVTTYKQSGTVRFTLPHQIIKKMGWEGETTFAITPYVDNTVLINPVTVIPKTTDLKKTHGQQLQTLKT